MSKIHMPVKPETLAWARVAAGYPTIDDVVRRVADLRKRKNGGADLLAWEAGEQTIGKIVAMALAKAYDLPVPYLYLPKETVASMVPDVTQITDFRMGASRRLTPNLIKYLRSVLYRQELLSEVLDPDEVPDLSWLGSGAGMSAGQLAVQIRQRLLADVPYPKTLTDWIKLVEERYGVAVMQSRTHHSYKVEPDFSGVALSDNTVPVIAMNSDGNEGRRKFTLIHELAHLLIGQNGISKVSDIDFSVSKNDVERFCNEVAAEVLMPRDVVVGQWNTIIKQGIKRGEAVKNAVKRVVLDTGASYSAVAVRAEKLQLIDRDEKQRLLITYDAFDREHRQKKQEKREQQKALGQSGGGMPQSLIARDRAGPSMTRHALIAYDEGRISSMDLYDIFGVKLNHLPKIAAVVDHHLVRWHGSVDSG